MFWPHQSSESECCTHKGGSGNLSELPPQTKYISYCEYTYNIILI